MRKLITATTFSKRSGLSSSPKHNFQTCSSDKLSNLDTNFNAQQAILNATYQNNSRSYKNLFANVSLPHPTVMRAI